MATRRKDGRWVERSRRQGKKHLIAYGLTEEEAKEKMKKMLETESIPLLPRLSNGTLAEFVYLVYTRHVYPEIRRTSRRKYDQLFQFHILPALGSLQISEIGMMEMDSMRRGLKRADGRQGDLSNAHIREVMLRTREVLDLAYQLGRTHRIDWRMASMPKKPKRKARHEPEADFTERILEAAQGTVLHGPLFCALFLGLRRGEICGLKWKAIDRKRLTLTVSEQFQPIYGQGPTKGETRIIPIPNTLLKHLDSLGDNDSEYVFTSNSQPLQPNVLSKRVPILCEEAGLRRSTLHDLRAYAASNLFALKVDPITIMEILGHTDLKTTMIYAYGREGNKRKALERLLKGVKRPDSCLSDTKM